MLASSVALLVIVDSFVFRLDKISRFYCKAPRKACTCCCRYSYVACASATGLSTASCRADNGPRLKERWKELPALRAHMLPHRPISAIEITGAAGVRSTLFLIPQQNSFISPLLVSLPSGKRQTRLPPSSAAAIYAKANFISSRFSLFGAIGHAMAIPIAPNNENLEDTMIHH